MMEKKDLKPHFVLKYAAETFSVSVEEIISKSREQKLFFIRTIISHYLRYEARILLNTVAIGRLINRDHTSVMHATNCHKINVNSIDFKSLKYQRMYNKFIEDCPEFSSKASKIIYKDVPVVKHIKEEKVIKFLRDMKGQTINETLINKIRYL